MARIKRRHISGQVPRQEAGASGVCRKCISSALFSPRALLDEGLKAFTLLRRGGPAALWASAAEKAGDPRYAEWVRRFDQLSEQDRRDIRDGICRLQHHPTISVLMPVYNTPEKLLRAAVESVVRQLYGTWELCIADDASSAPHIGKVLHEYARRDSRIRLVERSERGHISRATNSALELASGELIAFLDHDDELADHALYMIAQEVDDHPQAALIYSDEDKIDGSGRRHSPHFKSDWNPELILAQNYICHLAVYRASLLRQLGGIREGFEGAQDWDLALRAVQELNPSQIRHLPHVLYNWRAIRGSTSSSAAFKSYTGRSQLKAVAEHAARVSPGATVEAFKSGSRVRVRHALPKEAPFVSLIFTPESIGRNWAGEVERLLRMTKYPRYEVLAAPGVPPDGETLSGPLSNLNLVRSPQAVSCAGRNNHAVSCAKGEMLALLEASLEPVDSDWLSEMASYAVKPEIGAVGCRIVGSDGRLRHAGLILGAAGWAAASHAGRHRFSPGYFDRIALAQNVSAVGCGCIVLRREVYEMVGGLREDMPRVFNELDLCLRIRQKGFLITYAAHAELRCSAKGDRPVEDCAGGARFDQCVQWIRKTWGSSLLMDPYYNPNLDLTKASFELAFPPRVGKPWSRVS